MWSLVYMCFVNLSLQPYCRNLGHLDQCLKQFWSNAHPHFSSSLGFIKKWPPAWESTLSSLWPWFSAGKLWTAPSGLEVNGGVQVTLVLITSKGKITVMWVLYQTTVAKKKLSWKAKIWIYQLAYIPILTYNKIWWVRLWQQASEMSSLQRVSSLSLPWRCSMQLKLV